MSSRKSRFDAAVAQLQSLIDESLHAEQAQHKALIDVAKQLRPVDYTELFIGARRLRTRHFGRGLFGEPAWDILLELHVAHHRDLAISVSAAVTFGDTPQSTGLRWLALLEKEKMVERKADPFDQRRQFVSLTQKGVETMDHYIESFGEWASSKAVLRKL